MKIVLVNYFYNENFHSEDDLLRTYYTMVGWAEALHGLGADVTVISRFHENSELAINNVRYIFINDGTGPQFPLRKIPFKFLKAIAALYPDIVHLHHFTLSLQTLVLRFLLKKKTAIIIQHHGGKSPRGWKMKLHNRINNVADGYFFTAFEQGLAWFNNKKQSAKVMTVMEGGSFFDFNTRDAGRNYTYHHRDSSRKRTGMEGKPVFLWVGRLDKNKDPETVLQGFELFLQSSPQASLYMIYGDNELENAARNIIAQSAVLEDRVHMLGKIDHSALEAYYNSADYFVLGSHYEGSSYALSEALSCGCIPIVTDIPSLRMMTDDGALGALWQPGNKNSFARAAIAATKKPMITEANNCINYCRENLSFSAIARIALIHYREAIKRRSGH